MPFDSLHRPLKPIWTCTFLNPKRAADRAHGYYAACALGDAAARVKWVEEIRRERLDQLTRLQRQTAEIAAPMMEEIVAAKERQAAGGEHRAQATAELERLLDRLEAGVIGFIEASAEDFEAASLPVDACKQFIRLLVRDMVEQRHLRNYRFRPPPEVVDQFPPELRPMLFPAAPSQD